MIESGFLTPTGFLHQLILADRSEQHRSVLLESRDGDFARNSLGFCRLHPQPGLHKASNHVDVKRPQRDDSGECVPLETAPKDLSIVATTWLGNVAEGGLDPAG